MQNYQIFLVFSRWHNVSKAEPDVNCITDEDKTQLPQTDQCYVTSIVLYTKVDAQSDAERSPKLTTLVTVDIQLQNPSKSRVWDKVLQRSTCIFENTRSNVGHGECSLYVKN